MQAPAVKHSVTPVLPAWIVAPDIESTVDGPCKCPPDEAIICPPIPGPTRMPFQD